MKLDKHVVDMFTELTKPADDVKMEKTCYGTISVVDGTRYVKLDGSDLLVPAASTVKTSHGDRVTVLMKNHSLTVTGNLTAPATDGGGSSSGEAGTAATIEIGTVTTGEAGSSASVTNAGTKSEAVFDFVIPKGDKGEKGDKGDKGDTGTWDGTIPDHEHTVSDITDFPTSLPANGGNADTVGAKSISQILAVKGWFDGDMDNLKEQGSYIVNEATNMPIPGGWGTALVFIGGTGSVVQVFTAYVISASDLCKTYIRHFTGDLWSTWVNIASGGDADTLDGKHRYDFVNYIGSITDVDNILNNPEYSDCPYEGVISSEVATSIGLSSVSIADEWGIKCFRATDGSGFQIAVPIYRNSGESPKYRMANKYNLNGSDYVVEWGKWKNFSDNGNADTVDGKHANDFSQIINLRDTSTDTKTAIGVQYKTTTYWCSHWTDYPATAPDGQGMIIAVNYKGSGTTGTDNIWCRQIYINPRDPRRIYQRNIIGTTVEDWVNISDFGYHYADRTQIISGDLNDNITPGQFVVTSATTTDTLANQPWTTSGYYLDVYRRSANLITQIALRWNGKIALRYLDGNTWTGWTNIADGGNADTLDGLHVNEIASNPNLLDNPNFKINQRGLTSYSYTTNGYTVDRWKINSNAKLTVNDGFVTFENTTKKGTVTLYQIVENPAAFSGKTVTLSFDYDLKSEGASITIQALANNSWTPPVSFNSTGRSVKSNVITLPENLTDLRWVLVIHGTDSAPLAIVDVYGAKLELGKIATPIIPVDSATERAKCQRYYYSTYQGVSAGTPASYANELVLNAITANRFNHTMIDFPTTMRTTPTVRFFNPVTGEEGYACKGGTDKRVPVAIIIAGQDRVIFGSSGLTVGADYYLHYTASAEL